MAPARAHVRAGAAVSARRFVGVDPGLAGGVAVLEADDGGRVRVVELARTPTVLVRRAGTSRHEYDAAGMVALLHAVDRDSAPVDAVALELQGARPGQGVVSMYRTGVGFGLWWGILAGTGLAYHVVAPGVWKRHHGLSGADKRASRLKAQALFPELGVIRAADEGPAEALLMARWLAARELAHGGRSDAA